VFNKVETNRDLNKYGCGLGLIISRRLTRALGGDLLVKSKLN
jgi:signal transduction histidine kinase